MRCNGKVCRIHATIDGQVYEPGPIKASEAEQITKWTGYGLREWEGQVANGDPLAARGLLALVRFRKGEHVKMADVEIEDVDSIEADLLDPDGRRVTMLMDNDGEPELRKGKPVWLFDGEEDEDPPMPQPSPTG